MADSTVGANTDNTKPVVKQTPPRIIAVLQLNLFTMTADRGAVIVYVYTSVCIYLFIHTRSIYKII